MTHKSLFLFLVQIFFIYIIICIHCTQKPKASTIENIKLEKEGLEPQPLPLPKRSYWPTQNWRTKQPEELGLSSAGLAKLEKYAFSTPEERSKGRGIRTNSLLIVKDGYIAYEKYDAGYTKDSPQQLWSLSKCFVNALVGIAHREGLVELDKAAYHYLPLLDRPDKRSITVRHLLHMSSGIDWDSARRGFLFSKYDEIFMLWGKAHEDMPRAIASKEMRTPAGSYVYYSSGDGILLSAILRKVLKKRYISYPWKSLFNVIGMSNASIERDGAGNFILSGYVYAPARELAKFAFLYLNNGKWAKQTVLSEEWINFTRTLPPAYSQIKEKRQSIKRFTKTAHWYINTRVGPANIPAPWPVHTPRDTFGCQGHWRQRILIVPSLDMIIIRTAEDRNAVWKGEAFFKIMNESVLVKRQ